VITVNAAHFETIAKFSDITVVEPSPNPELA
jgi:hypothetical protein